MRNSDYFDKAAGAWDEDPKRIGMAKAIFAAIRASVTLSPEMDALDYGCGTGLLSVQLSSRVRRVTGADSSEGMIRALRGKIVESKNTNIEAVKLDLELDPVPSSRYQLVVSGMALHHIGDVQKVIRAFYELLLPGGRLCIADLDAEPGLFHDEKAAATVRHSGFKREELMAIMAEAGFGGLTAATAHTISKVSADGVKRDFPVFLITGRK